MADKTLYQEKFNKQMRFGAVNDNISRIERGIANQNDVFELTKEIGRASNQALAETIAEAGLTGEEAAELTEAVIADNYAVISDYAELVQKGQYELAELGIQPRQVNLSQAQYKQQALNVAAQVDATTAAAYIINEDVVNLIICQAFDNIMQQYAEQNKNLGIPQKIKREWDGRESKHDTRGTDWCKAVQGTYDYPVTDNRVWQRHKRCGCSITNIIEAAEKAARKLDRYSIGQAMPNSEQAKKMRVLQRDLIKVVKGL